MHGGAAAGGSPLEPIGSTLRGLDFGVAKGIAERSLEDGPRFGRQAAPERRVGDDDAEAAAERRQGEGQARRAERSAAEQGGREIDGAVAGACAQRMGGQAIADFVRHRAERGERGANDAMPLAMTTALRQAIRPASSSAAPICAAGSAMIARSARAFARSASVPVVLTPRNWSVPVNRCARSAAFNVREIGSLSPGPVASAKTTTEAGANSGVR